MALSARFKKGDVEAYFKKKMALIDKAIVDRLIVLGEKCVAEARELNTYKDQSGNLRSSIGYVVVRNGVAVSMSGFEKAAPWGEYKGNDFDNGEAGRGLATSLSSSPKYASGYALVVVAGMNYAAYVEANGYDVLDSTEKLAERELPRMLRELKSNIKRMK